MKFSLCKKKYGGILRLNADYLNFFKFDNDINFLLPFKFSNNNHLLKIEKKI